MAAKAFEKKIRSSEGSETVNASPPLFTSFVDMEEKKEGGWGLGQRRWRNKKGRERGGAKADEGRGMRRSNKKLKRNRRKEKREESGGGSEVA